MNIVNFHNVLPELSDDFDRRGAPRTDTAHFVSAIDWLSDRFEIISLNDMLVRLYDRRQSAPPAVSITFDDGYRGVLSHAFPILAERGLSASVMVITQALSHPTRLFHFEEIELAFRTTRCRVFTIPGQEPWPLDTQEQRVECMLAVKRYLKLQPEAKRGELHNVVLASLDITSEALKDAAEEFTAFTKLDINDLSTLMDAGWIVGSHTQTHRTLSQLNDEEIAWEVKASSDQLQAHFALERAPFAYPYGAPQHIGHRAAGLVAETGYSCAMTTTPGLNDSTTDPFNLRRINFEEIESHWPQFHNGVVSNLGRGS